MKRTGWSTALSCVLLACGGTTTQTPETTDTEQAALAAEPAQPVADPEPDPEEEVEADPEDDAEVEDEAEEVAEPPRPLDPPLTNPTAEALEEAFKAASADRHAFRRLVDPAWGVGVFDPAEAGVRQYCDMRNIANNPGLGFIFNHGDEFSCNRALTRCTVRDDRRSGYALVLREGEGDVVWLNAIVHYPRRLSNSESGPARAFVRAGDGVCGLYGVLRDPESVPPDRFSVFVSEQTGLVPEALAEHHCADAAATAYQERLAPVRRRRPRECNRGPSRCDYRSGDEDYAVYATEEGVPYAVAITRHGMHDDLARAQNRDLERFLRDARRHSCE